MFKVATISDIIITAKNLTHFFTKTRWERTFKVIR